MLFEELVEQHRVHCVIPDGENFSLSVFDDQVWIYLLYFLGDQPELGCGCVVSLVVEGHWLESQDRFTALIHWFYVFFEPRRGSGRAKLAGVGHDDWQRGGALGSCAVNVPDPGGITHVLTRDVIADCNNVTGVDNASAGLLTDSDVRITVDALIERVITDGCVHGARRDVEHGVITERIIFRASAGLEDETTMGVVEVTGGVAPQRLKTKGIVIRAGGIVKERLHAGGGIRDASGVAKKRIYPSGRVLRAGGVVRKGIDTGGCILRAGRVVEQRTRAIGRIVTGGGIAKERINPSGRVLRADRVAVERLYARGGVEDAGGIAKERAKTLTAVVGATGVAEQRLKTNSSVVGPAG